MFEVIFGGGGRVAGVGRTLEFCLGITIGMLLRGGRGGGFAFSGCGLQDIRKKLSWKWSTHAMVGLETSCLQQPLEGFFFRSMLTL